MLLARSYRAKKLVSFFSNFVMIVPFFSHSFSAVFILSSTDSSIFNIIQRLFRSLARARLFSLVSTYIIAIPRTLCCGEVSLGLVEIRYFSALVAITCVSCFCSSCNRQKVVLEDQKKKTREKRKTEEIIFFFYSISLRAYM